MLQINLDMFQAAAVACGVLLLGRFLVSKIELLRRYCIPEPVVGGVIFALVHLVLRSMGILEITFDATIQTIFMNIFFCSVGFAAAFCLLKKGGKLVLIFLALAISMVVVQNLTGAGLATVFGLDPRFGLATASIPMVGGHGTSAAFGPVLEKAGVVGAEAVAIASATFGLVAGCLIGGPIASSVIKKHSLKPTETATGSAEGEEETAGKIDSTRFLNAMMFLLIALGIGTIIGKYLSKIVIFGQQLSFPGYIGAMLAAAVIRNIFDIKGKDVPMEEINTIGSYSLSVFLGLAMMGLKLWQLAELALPMIVMLAAQTVLMFVVARFVCFNILGRSYDAAVITAGFCGFGMGATPNAMANMQAVTKKNGPSPTAFLVVPLVGSLFIDLFNSTIITLFISFLA
ncbi:MAG: sodium/glutamate symporter [Oscillospiraceae bacterium]|nr:sodium/glutamate symporter [Oscillospiraceae bacterium]